MVNSSYVHSGETNVSDGTCGGDEASSTTTSGGHFNWDEATQVGITRKYGSNLTTLRFPILCCDQTKDI